jgi:hypothetical protein
VELPKEPLWLPLRSTLGKRPAFPRVKLFFDIVSSFLAMRIEKFLSKPIEIQSLSPYTIWLCVLPRENVKRISRLR